MSFHRMESFVITFSRAISIVNRMSFKTRITSIIRTMHSSNYVSNDKYITSDSIFIPPKHKSYDVIIIGGGHNGLIASAYLSKAGLKVLVLERRHIVGGAAVTEEIIPGFKFSRASYLAGLLRPHIIKDLQLEKYGFKYLPRNPSSFTPTKFDSIYQGKYLMLGDDMNENMKSIAQFSIQDSYVYPKYEEFLNQVREIMQPLLDNPPPDLTSGNILEKMRTLSTMRKLIQVGYKHKSVLVPFYELLTGPAEQILDRWFECDILKTTLATDAVIGALTGPQQNGSAYVLLHHIMGEAAGKKGVWAYLEGGMGALSNAVATASLNYGTEIITNASVKKILYKEDLLDDNNNNNNNNNKKTKQQIFSDKVVTGVQMRDETILEAPIVISATNSYHTFIELLDLKKVNFNATSTEPLEKFLHHIDHTDYSCGAFKINCAVNRLPNFSCYPGIPLHTDTTDVAIGPMHKGTIHFEYHMKDLINAYKECSLYNKPATRPVIEMTIPSAIDHTLVSPKYPGHHVVQLFIQFAPYKLDPSIGSWDNKEFKEAFVNRCFSIIDEFCPGFSKSIIGLDVLSPLDLERIFGLHQGSISHGSFGIHQLGYARPMSGYSSYRSPIQGLYMASASTHPGGGVMGACGYNCAQVILNDKYKL